ncbi:uncharacterized protein JNUCC1_00852 [Lentibacillus sp. JNUCC-1]|uniref:DUF1806 family protein n=1 Tax=Lentibacillus sp. JNUCC-1 TaxID=2654513 RepID=UPI0012E87068|nr:DUF1806 family protein [Lentibacillus sp. JNUCC-1]MUV37046.1 uncharacterized protein [Lentibacillus sp. JNUCC-1]
MQPIEINQVQKEIDKYVNEPIFLHMETSTGSYVRVQDPETLPACAYIRNGKIKFSEGKIVKNEAWFSVGLKLDDGWVYSEGLTDWEVLEEDKLLLAGHDKEGNLKIGLELSKTPFDCGE